MSRFAKLFAANAIAAAGLGAAAIALSATAAADPSAAVDPIIPPAVPGIPALSMIQQFATNPASVGAVLQTAATALNGASELVGAPAPNTLPVSPIQGAPGVLPAPAVPLAPAAPVAAPALPGQTLVPLLNQLGVPANLVGLAPAGLGLLPAAPLAPVSAPLVAPAAPLVAPAAPLGAAAPVNAVPLLNALP